MAVAVERGRMGAAKGKGGRMVATVEGNEGNKD
jgi:hypothetical protein